MPLIIGDCQTSASGHASEDRAGAARDLAWVIDGATDVVERPLTNSMTDADWIAAYLDGALTALPSPPGGAVAVAGLDRRCTSRRDHAPYRKLREIESDDIQGHRHGHHNGPDLFAFCMKLLQKRRMRPAWTFASRQIHIYACRMILMKFGGTSVGNAEAISHVASVVRHSLGRKPVVVVSAMTKITDALIQLAEESTKGTGSETLKLIRSAHEQTSEALGIGRHICEPELRELEQLVSESRGAPLDAKRLDLFQSFGERMCAKIVAAKLSNDGIAARAYNAWDVGMITDDHFGNAEPLASSYSLIKKAIAEINEVPVVTGFIGKTKAGEVTTLGRGGTDYSTSIIGAAIGAEAIQIWKEVDGIMTTDPRIVPEARVVPQLAFEEACELAYFGAKVLHPKTIMPAMKAHIPVEVRNTFKPELPGTTIVSTFAERSNKSAALEALSIKRRVTMLHIASPEFFEGSGLMARIFSVLEKRGVSVDVIATSVASVSLTMEHEERLEEIAKELSDIGEVSIEANKAIICAVGGSVNAAGVAGRMFSVLGDAGVAISVEMISQAAGGVSITFVVDEKDAEQAVKALHKEYLER